MNFNSPDYLVFLPVVVTVHWLLPHRFRWILLLGRAGCSTSGGTSGRGFCWWGPPSSPGCADGALSVPGPQRGGGHC